MNTKRKCGLIVIALGLSLSSPGWTGGLTLQPGSRLWLEGNSTLHTFSSSATQINTSFTLSPNTSNSSKIEEIISSGTVKGLVVTIPILGIKSRESGLDKNMRKALKADQFPDIVFTMDGYRIDRTSATTIIAASGNLAIAGEKKSETIGGTIKYHGGRAVIDGKQALLMTDFGVNPPTMMFGAIKTYNRIVVKFHLELEQSLDDTHNKSH